MKIYFNINIILHYHHCGALGCGVIFCDIGPSKGFVRVSPTFEVLWPWFVSSTTAITGRIAFRSRIRNTLARFDRTFACQRGATVLTEGILKSKENGCIENQFPAGCHHRKIETKIDPLKMANKWSRKRLLFDIKAFQSNFQTEH